MKSYVYLILGVAVIITACSSKPKELLAPCTWEQRSGCAPVVTLSHQDQL